MSWKIVDGEASVIRALANGHEAIYMPHYFTQEAKALEWLSGRHKKLIDAGFTWDGMDGYTAPEGMSVSDFQRVVQEGWK